MKQNNARPGPAPVMCLCPGEPDIDRVKGQYQLKVVFSIGKFVLYKKGPMKYQCKKCQGYRNG